MWRGVDTNFSILRVIDAKIRELHALNGEYLPDFGSSPSLFVGSDYSGEHKESQYLGFTFIFLPVESWRNWDRSRQAARRKHCIEDGRRFGYAKMNDPRKRVATGELLEALTEQRGLLVSLSVRKVLKSVFDTSGQLDRSSWGVEHCVGWANADLEKMLRVVHTVAFFTAGIASGGQNVRWITDHDNIAANEQRFQQMAVVFRNVLDQYLSVRLNSVSCSTTFGSPLEVEDFAAIPDLVGGAIVELFTAHARNGHDISEATFPRPDKLPLKTHEILDSLAQPGHLRRVFYKVEPGPALGTIEIADINIAAPLPTRGV
jgi:hypothetical protein